ncbi:hypothetical protein N8T08_008801 [Aspergillus melleus]|uniref:Uncharacterized protein n=1 Tax=Aspergillus melleus TaxID=138277 RepID=A0ACC3AVK8_9EURO|nr:hypothetical protein N8T08_008801 [Aspergillus melleus]
MSTGSLDLFNDKCVKEQSSEAQEYEAGIVARIGQGALGPNGRNTNPRLDKRPKHKKKPTMRGDYKVINYDKNDKDYQVTYICRYGHGFDEVCDNQRWAIDKATYTYTSKAAPEVPLTVTVTDHGFRALTDDPMFTKYGWPKNDYKKLPSEDYQPQDIHDGQWLKRDVALNVLEQNLPLSAIEEADMILAHKASQRASHGSTPTDASIHSEPRPTHIDTSRRSLGGGLPRETGSPPADDSSPEGHTRERLKRHLQMHQWHHGH